MSGVKSTNCYDYSFDGACTATNGVLVCHNNDYLMAAKSLKIMLWQI